MLGGASVLVILMLLFMSQSVLSSSHACLLSLLRAPGLCQEVAAQPCVCFLVSPWLPLGSPGLACGYSEVPSASWLALCWLCEERARGHLTQDTSASLTVLPSRWG